MAALIVVVLILGVALRSPLEPGVRSADREPPTGGTATLVGLVAIVAACVLVITVAIVMSWRDLQRPIPQARPAIPRSGGPRGPRSWRLVLICLAAVSVWLIAVALLAQLWSPEKPAETPTPASSGHRPDAGHSVSRPPAGWAANTDQAFWYLAAAAAAFILVTFVGAVLISRRRRGSRVESGDPVFSVETSPPDPEPLVLAAERGLAEVGNLSRGPREAIIACYAAMEQALASAPGAAPQESDTPTEVLARAVEHRAIRAEGATELVQLFAEARFSTHVMNEGHRSAAEGALRLVLDGLRSSV